MKPSRAASAAQFVIERRLRLPVAPTDATVTAVERSAEKAVDREAFDRSMCLNSSMGPALETLDELPTCDF